MPDAMAELLGILDLEALEHNLFRGRSLRTSWQRVFGGQVLAQALMAAARTAGAGRFVHSLHGGFMRPGDSCAPIVYQVSRLRDGGSFSTRLVNAVQGGEAIFSALFSLQIDEDGLDHQMPMPDDVPPPERLAGGAALAEALGAGVPESIRRYWARPRPFEVRPATLDHYTSREKLAPRQDIWVRASAPVPADRHLQAAVLAYLSDMTLLDTSTFAHGRAIFDPDIQAASLDHAMWFHRPHALEGWLLYTQDSPSASGARGFTRGRIYARDGVLIASVAQEGLIRLRNRQGCPTG